MSGGLGFRGGICPLPFSLTRSDGQFPPSVPNATLSDCLSAAFHTHLVPPVLSGIFPLTPGVTWIGFCLIPCPLSNLLLMVFKFVFFNELPVFYSVIYLVYIYMYIHRPFKLRTPDPWSSSRLLTFPSCQAPTENTLSCYGQQESLHETVVFARSNHCGQWEDWGHCRNGLTYSWLLLRFSL